MSFYQQLLHTENFEKPILVFEIGNNNVFKSIDDAEEIVVKNTGDKKRSNFIVKGMPNLNQLFKIKSDLKFKEPLIIFDDFVSVLTRQMWEDYFRYIHNASRLSAKLCSCVQSINKIPPQVRSSYTIVVLFTNYLTNSVIMTLLRNCVNNPMLDKKNTEYILKIIDKDDNKIIKMNYKLILSFLSLLNNGQVLLRKLAEVLQVQIYAILFNKIADIDNKLADVTLSFDSCTSISCSKFCVICFNDVELNPLYTKARLYF